MGKWLYISLFTLQLMVGQTFAQTAVKPKPLSQNVRAFKLQAEKALKIRILNELIKDEEKKVIENNAKSKRLISL
mgnify:CR=1 FL=1